ncbi:MAG: PKD domain-containing protein, partial [Solirubrobacteraceae bacterium]
VQQLDMGGSHRGDAIFGFLQGSGSGTQIAAVVVRAPPGEFVTDAPLSWIKTARIPLQWEVPLAGAGKLTYSILVDDREVAENITSSEYALSPSQVGEGVHTLQVEATDSLGQVVDSEPATLKVDRKPPSVRVSVRGTTVTVRVSDGPKGEVSGVELGSVKVRFGDGHSAGGRKALRHTYTRAGTYTIVVSASDNAGNKATVRKQVRVS